VNSSIGKLWDLLGHFDEKDFKKSRLYLSTHLMKPCMISQTE